MLTLSRFGATCGTVVTQPQTLPESYDCKSLFSPFLPGSHTPTSMNQKGPESPGHVTESAHRASPHLARPHETKITGALWAEEHQAGMGLPSGNNPKQPPQTLEKTPTWKWGSPSPVAWLKGQSRGLNLKPVAHVWGLWEAAGLGLLKRGLSTTHCFPQQGILVVAPSWLSGCC